LRGQLRRSRRELHASLEEAVKLGMQFETAQTLLARGELGCRLGWPGAEMERAQARGLLEQMGASFACHPQRVLSPAAEGPPVPLSMADRFASIVDHGRRISSALSAEEVHQALCEASAALLRGQANLVLSADMGEPRFLASIGGPVELSHSLLAQAHRD